MDQPLKIKLTRGKGRIGLKADDFLSDFGKDSKRLCRIVLVAVVERTERMVAESFAYCSWETASGSRPWKPLRAATKRQRHGLGYEDDDRILMRTAGYYTRLIDVLHKNLDRGRAWKMQDNGIAVFTYLTGNDPLGWPLFEFGDENMHMPARKHITLTNADLSELWDDIVDAYESGEEL